MNYYYQYNRDMTDITNYFNYYDDYDVDMFDKTNDFNYNNIEFRNIIINNNEVKDMLDLYDIIYSFNNMHI